MEEIKQGWKKRISWLLIALTVVIVYKMLDNFSNVTQWVGTFFRILKPFHIVFGILLLLYALIDKVIFKNNIKYIKFKNKITLKLHIE